jgi:hypothetical protein
VRRRRGGERESGKERLNHFAMHRLKNGSCIKKTAEEKKVFRQKNCINNSFQIHSCKIALKKKKSKTPMKTSIIVVVLLITSALAVTDKSKFRDQLSSLMNMQSRAVDAVNK